MTSRYPHYRCHLDQGHVTWHNAAPVFGGSLVTWRASPVPAVVVGVAWRHISIEIRRRREFVPRRRLKTACYAKSESRGAIIIRSIRCPFSRCCFGWTKILAAGLPLPQGGGGAGGHGQPQAGSPSTPGPGGGTAGSGASTLGAAGGGASGSGTAAAGGSGIGFSVTGGSTGGGAGGGAAGGGAGWSAGPPRRGRGWRDWRRGDPTLIKGLWKSKGPLGKGSVFLREFSVFWMCIWDSLSFLNPLFLCFSVWI